MERALDYSNRSNVRLHILKRRKNVRKDKERVLDRCGTRRIQLIIVGFKNRRETLAKECEWLLEAESGLQLIVSKKIGLQWNNCTEMNSAFCLHDKGNRLCFRSLRKEY